MTISKCIRVEEQLLMAIVTKAWFCLIPFKINKYLLKKKNPDDCGIFFVLYVKADTHHITILYNVFLSFHAHFSRFLYFLLASEIYIIVIFYHFRANETFFKIGVYYPCGLRFCCAHG